jgi:homeobox protein Nkx-2.1
MSASLATNAGSFPDDPESEQNLLPDLNGVDLVMSLSPKTNQHLQHLQTLQQNSLHNINHSTPFSVSDILSPIEEYRKLELNPPSPYRYADCQSVRCERIFFKVKFFELKFFPTQFQIKLKRI